MRRRVPWLAVAWLLAAGPVFAQDAFEPDNDAASASLPVVGGQSLGFDDDHSEQPQSHDLHLASDQDWALFHGADEGFGGNYAVTLRQTAGTDGIILNVFSEFTLLEPGGAVRDPLPAPDFSDNNCSGGASELFADSISPDGPTNYYIQVLACASAGAGLPVAYDLLVGRPDLPPEPALLTGRVSDALSGAGLPAVVFTSTNATSFTRPGTAQYVMVADQGNLEVTAVSQGYQSQTIQVQNVQPNETRVADLALTPTFFIFANGFEDATP